MKFKPILGSDLSGHVGGVVASHNTYGPYFRQRVRPVNKKTPAQSAQRAAIAFVSQTWRALSTTVQASWTSAVLVHTSRKGDRVTLTGQAAYMQLNTLRRRIGLALLPSPPTDPTAVPLTPPAVVFTAAAAVTIDFAADAWNDADGGVIVSGALLTSSGKTFASPINGVVTLVNPGTSPVAVTLPFAVPIGARLRLVFHATSPDGRQSTYVSVDATNTSFAPPILLPAIVSVENVGGSDFRINFNAPITATAVAIPELVIDGDTGGTVTTALAGTLYILATYAMAAGAGLAWTLASQPAAITTPLSLPESGTTV